MNYLPYVPVYHPPERKSVKNKTRKYTRLRDVPEGAEFFHVKLRRVFVRGEQLPRQNVFLCTHVIGTGTEQLGGNAEVYANHNDIGEALTAVMNEATADFAGYFRAKWGRRGMTCGSKKIYTEITVEEEDDDK